jgi:hypothetical protein
MTDPQAHRRVWLIDGQAPARPNVSAELYRGLSARVLDEIETAWAAGREAASRDLIAAGLAPLEHDHWCWRNKAQSVEDGRHLLVAVACEGRWQGVMAVARLPRASRLGGDSVVYVDFLETAPWNLRLAAAAPRFKAVGLALLVDAVRMSVEAGLGVGVGLHSLPQAEPFYARCGMTRIGEDPDYFGLPYYECTGPQATAWLASIGEAT